MTTEPWVASDEATERAKIRRELAGFGWDLTLPPDQVAAIRRMEAAERAEHLAGPCRRSAVGSGRSVALLPDP
jgi:hypothetical protein